MSLSARMRPSRNLPALSRMIFRGMDYLSAGQRKGISPKYWTLIFAPLTRLHGREIPGSGIGFATCRRMVEWHGGKIWVESEVGVGSTFYFTFRKNGEVPDGSRTPHYQPASVAAD